jgi:hypothetical protein
VHIAELLSKMAGAERKLSIELGREPTVDETMVLPLTNLTVPALAASPHCDPYCVGQPTARVRALSLNFTKITYTY